MRRVTQSPKVEKQKAFPAKSRQAAKSRKGILSETLLLCGTLRETPPNKAMKVNLHCLLLLFLTLHSQAQPLFFEHLTMAQGFSQNTVNCKTVEYLLLMGV
jgi:hypothetical protein